MSTTEYEYMDFEVVKEVWHSYELEDKTKLRLKFVLSSVVKAKQGGYLITFESVVGLAYVPPELRGPIGRPSKAYTHEELSKAIDKEDLKFTLLSPEEWNVYKLADGTTLSIKPVVVEINRTKLYNERGEPIYLVLSQPLVKAKPVKR